MTNTATRELILHHYPTSPFSEKVRLVFGAKRLSWRSVHIPVVMPKPDLVALTGGYRRTPVLQVGADIYCDTALICRALDELQPEPPLVPEALRSSAQLLSQWADTQLFWVAIPYTLQPAATQAVFGDVPPEALKAFAADRAALRPGALRPTPEDAAVALRTYLGWLEHLMSDGRNHIAGPQLSIADFSVAHALWFVQRVPPVAGVLDGHARLQDWLARMLAIGHGASTPMRSTEALDVAAQASAGGAGFASVQVEPGLGLEAGDSVMVTPTDYGFDPVHGSLVGLTRDSVTVCRRDERAGIVQVHFPRLGFQVRKA